MQLTNASRAAKCEVKVSNVPKPARERQRDRAQY
ncbi:hypothetical protein BN1263500072 [Stenotrophomonas indicatrix]|nr:hypothetical protein BN1263500072 [Stenotrophomonas indicatrix]